MFQVFVGLALGTYWCAPVVALLRTIQHTSEAPVQGAIVVAFLAVPLLALPCCAPRRAVKRAIEECALRGSGGA